MTSVFFISIDRRIDPSAKLTTAMRLEACGANFGNMLFTDALHRQLKYDTSEAGFDFDPAYVQERFDYVAIPAANWVGARADFGWQAALLEKTTLPILMVGVGAQATVAGEMPKLQPGTARLLAIASERSRAIGVRGTFSAEVLEHYGIKNTVVTGCPSLFWRCEPGQIVNKASVEELTTLRVAAGSTRYQLRSKFAESSSDDVNKLLFELCYRNQWPYIVQSEVQEARFAFEGDIELTDREWAKLCGVYGCPSKHDLRRYLKSKAIAFLSVPDWIDYARTMDFYIGSRLHGAISFFLAGKPAVLVSHDSRTAEMAKTAAMPEVSLFDLRKKSAKQIYCEADFDSFNQRWSQLYINYVNFLADNCVAHNLAAHSHGSENASGSGGTVSAAT